MRLRTKIKKYHTEIRKFQQKEEYDLLKNNENFKIFHKDIEIRNFIYEETVKMTEKLSAIKKSSVKKNKGSIRKIANYVGGVGLTSEELMIFYLEIFDDIIQTKNIKDLDTPYVSSHIRYNLIIKALCSHV